MLSFADQTLAEMTPALSSLMERWWNRDCGDLWTWPGYNLNRFGFLPIPAPPPSEPARLNTLVFPSCASRWGVFHALCGQDQATAILAAVNTNAPTPQTLLIRDDANGTQISPSMYLLGLKPVFVTGATGKLWWITLVDFRYWGWQKSLSYTFAPGDTWTTLLTNLVSAAFGLVPTIPAIPAAYGSPAPLRWTNPGKPLPLLIDAAAATVGLRFVVHLNGTCEFLTAAAGETADSAQFTANLANLSYGGRNSVTDVSGNVPASVVVSSWGDVQELTTVTLASLALPSYGTITGVAGKSAWIMGDRYAQQSSPTASAYATQAATDYYGWALGLTDAVFRGILPLEPTGQEDRLEWEYVPARWPNVKPPGDDVRGVAGRDLESSRLPWERLTSRVVRSNWADRNLYGDRFPPGFTYPVKLLSTAGGGVWKAQIRTTASGSIGDGPKLGWKDDAAVLYLDPATATAQVGARGTAIPDPLVPDRWIFERSSDPDDSADCAPGCGWVSGLRTDGSDCLTLTVLSALGRCACADTGAELTLTYSADKWTSGSSKIEICGVQFTVSFNPDGPSDDDCTGPCLTLTSGTGSGSTTYTGTRDCCGKNFAVFSFGQIAICTDDTDCLDGPAGNVLRLKIAWEACANPNYAGPGWYCTADCNDPNCEGVLTCQNLTEDPGSTLTLCSGPYIDQTSCATGCNGTIIQDCAVCSGQSIPNKLYLSVVSNGCALPLCPSTGSGQVVEPPLIHTGNVCGLGVAGWSTTSTAVCTNPPGQTACIYVNVCFYCSGGVYKVDVIRTQENADCTAGTPVAHNGLAVTVDVCSEFCGTFVVPADAVCASDTTYRISANPLATCGLDPPVTSPLGSATATGTNSATATIAGKTTASGDLVIVSVEAVVSVGVGATVSAVTVTYNGVSVLEVMQESFAANGAIVGRVAFYDLPINAPTTGDIVAAVTGVGAIIVNVTAVKVSNLVHRTIDQGVGASGLATQPNSGTSGVSTAPSTMAYAAVGQFRVGTPDAGTWGGGFTQEQTELSGTSSLRLSDASLLLTTPAAFDASLAVTNVPTVWVALAANWK